MNLKNCSNEKTRLSAFCFCFACCACVCVSVRTYTRYLFAVSLCKCCERESEITLLVLPALKERANKKIVSLCECAA